MQLKIGNAVSFIIDVVDACGDVVSNLPSTTEIVFMIKENIDDVDELALVTKRKSNGDITVDDPELGSVTVSVKPADTYDADPGTYFYALELTYSPTNKVELDLKENDVYLNTIELVQEVIRGV